MYPVSTRTSNKPCESRFMALLLKIPYVTERVCIHVVCSSHSTVSCSAGGHWTSSQHRQAVDLRQWKIDSSRHTKSMKKLLKSMVYGPKKEMIYVYDEALPFFFIYVFDLLVVKCQILMDNGGRWSVPRVIVSWFWGALGSPHCRKNPMFVIAGEHHCYCSYVCLRMF